MEVPATDSIGIGCCFVCLHEISRRRQELRHGRHRVIVRGLPHGFSWQDLKDMFKKAGDAVFADISRDGDGYVFLLPNHSSFT